MLSPRFIPESVFYTQSVVRSPQSVFYTDRLTFLFFSYDACIIKFCGTADFFDLSNGTVLELKRLELSITWKPP